MYLYFYLWIETSFEHILKSLYVLKEDVKEMAKKADEIEWNKLSKSGKANLYLLKDQFDTFTDGMEHKG